jgi:hypothetical protein
MTSRRLSTYLNDHLAGSTAALELARRSARSNQGTSLGELLDQLATEIAEDKRVLEGLMDRVGVRVDRTKTAAAWAAEKLGRFKLNGRVFSYSPLSRLEELELLVLAVEGKILLWRSLERWGGQTLPSTELQELIKRGRSQRQRLERRRLDAVADAL